MRVRVKSLLDAFEYVMDHYYPNGLRELAIKTDTYAVISIQDTHNGGYGVTFEENEFCKGVLTLYFDDIVRPVEGAVLFDEKMAEEIIRFIRAQKTVDTLLVHCFAGASRSRAVGAFAEKMLGVEESRYLTTGTPNLTVYHTLMSVWENYRETAQPEGKQK